MNVSSALEVAVRPLGTPDVHHKAISPIALSYCSSSSGVFLEPQWCLHLGHSHHPYHSGSFLAPDITVLSLELLFCHRCSSPLRLDISLDSAVVRHRCFFLWHWGSCLDFISSSQISRYICQILLDTGLAHHLIFVDAIAHTEELDDHRIARGRHIMIAFHTADGSLLHFAYCHFTLGWHLSDTQASLQTCALSAGLASPRSSGCWHWRAQNQHTVAG